MYLNSCVVGKSRQRWLFLEGACDVRLHREVYEVSQYNNVEWRLTFPLLTNYASDDWFDNCWGSVGGYSRQRAWHGRRRVDGDRLSVGLTA